MPVAEAEERAGLLPGLRLVSVAPLLFLLLEANLRLGRRGDTPPPPPLAAKGTRSDGRSAVLEYGR